MTRSIQVLAVFLFIATSALADRIRFAWPVDCELGVDCEIQQYVDRDPTGGFQDYNCGTLSYDGHNGTDIRVANVAAMKKGIAVISAQAGTVAGVRDGLPDIDVTTQDAADVSGRECGNGVVISHGDGWETQYCHLRRSSVQVRSGDFVQQGQILGEIGMSGLAAFPHLHFAVRKNGEVVDPFAPDSVSGCADQILDQLWFSPVPYQPTGLLDAGFSTEIPPFDRIKQGMPVLSKLSQETPALVVWASYFGPHAGDHIYIEIVGPEGFVFEHQHIVERDQAQAMWAAGRRRPPDGWPLGSYTATISYSRKSARQWHIERSISIYP